MTDRDVRRALLALAVPVCLETLFQTSLGFIDQVILFARYRTSRWYRIELKE